MLEPKQTTTKSVTDLTKQTELIACESIRRSKLYWYQTNEQINFMNAINLEQFKELSTKNLKLEQTLKRFFLSTNFDSEFNFKFINSFILLEYLGIEFNAIKNLLRNQILELPNLRIIHLYNNPTSIAIEFKIKLKAPKLTTICCFKDAIDFLDLQSSKDTIKHLMIEYYSNRCEQFKNLETLQCSDIMFGSSSFDRNILKILEKLKILNLNSFKYQSTEYERLVSNVEYIKKQKIVLKRTDLQIFLNGVLLEASIKLDNNDKEPLSFQLKNYDLLKGDLSSFTDLKYDTLLEKCPNNIPNDFFKKYFNIQRIELSNVKVIDQNQFILALKSLKCLTELVLINVTFNQLFYDQLPANCQLTCLKIEEIKSTSIEFSFILKFKILKDFETTQDVSADLAILAIKNLKNLHSFEIKFKNFKITRRKDNAIYSICYFNEKNPYLLRQKTLNKLEDATKAYEDVFKEIEAILLENG